MKILMITLRTDLGGGPKHVLDLIRSLPKSENGEVIEYFLASPLDPPFGESLKSEFKDHFYLKPRSFDLITLIKLFRFIKKNKIRIIHSHGRGAGLYSRLLSLLGLKVVHTFHGIHQDKSFIGRIKLSLDKILSRFCDYYIYCSLDEKKVGESLNLTSNRLHIVIPNGIVLGRYGNSITDSSEPLRLKMGVMARHDFQKGLDLLIINLLELKKRGIDFEFSIAGTDNFEFNVPLELKKNIFLLGKLDNPQRFLDSINLYVSHSRWEGLPLSVLEVMDFGIPCLLSNVTGHQYFIEENVALGFDLNNSDSFINGVHQLKNSSIDRLRLISSAKELIHSKHDVKVMALSVLEIYKKLS
jgi:glycosyltransferase involved in cell wall biosynthesis